MSACLESRFKTVRIARLAHRVPKDWRKSWADAQAPVVGSVTTPARLSILAVVRLTLHGSIQSPLKDGMGNVWLSSAASDLGHLLMFLLPPIPCA